MKVSILYGIDVFMMQYNHYKNKRIALVSNDAALTSNGIKSRTALLQAGFKLTLLFSPEHGLYRVGEDGVAQENTMDEETGIPIISLYGKQLAPTEEQLKDIDLLIFDMPDVGCRFYTYLWTMTHVMESCSTFNKPMLVLDRPNPLGANILNAEGPMLDEMNCSSFIGRYRIPVTHGCSLVELALYFAAIKMPGLNLEVIKLQHYHREHNALNDFAFISTSPAMPNINSALLYPGLGLLEGINVNEGRGTNAAFTICGAPFIFASDLLHKVEQKKLPGIIVKPISYQPKSGLYKHEICHGLTFTIVHAAIVKPVALGIALIQSLFELYPMEIEERLYPTLVNPSGTGHLSRLLGVKDAFTILKNKQTVQTDLNDEWQKIISPYLLY